MKKLTVLFLGLLAAATLSAAPFARWFDFPGANGKTYPIYGEGDEFSAWFEAEDGHAVGFNDTAKAYEYLKPQADGSLVGTGILVGGEAGHEAELTAIPLHARDTSKAHEEEVRARIEEDDAVLRKTERWELLKASGQQDEEGRRTKSAPSSTTIGKFTGCILLVEFSDVKWPSHISKADMETYANDETGKTMWGNASSIWQFYQDVSCGNVSYKNVVIGPVTVPHPRSYYDDTSKDSGQCARSLIGDALSVLQNSSSSVREGLSSVTKRNNKCVVLNVFFAGNEASVWSKGLWACQWTLATSPSIDGVSFSTFQISPITSNPISYHFAHENGHALCGFPDLYNAGGAHAHCLMGNTCLMAGRPNDRDPQAPSAYLRAAAGWVEPKTLPNNTYVTLTRDYDDVYKYKNPNNENEYYLIENRGQRHDQDKTRHDGSISGSGIVIYHCMANGNNKSIDWNTAFSAETSNVRYRCKCEATLEQADGQYHHERNQWIADANDFWSAGNTAADYPGEFSDLTVPTARWADGTPSGLVLSEFSANGDTMTFAVGTPVIEGAPTISGTITAGGYVGTGKLTISNFGTGASSADVFVDIYGEATKKTLVGSVNLATGVTSTSEKTYTFPLVNGLASQYLRFRVVNNKGKAAYGTLTEAANGKAGDSTGGWGTDGGNEFGKAVDAPSLTINYTQNGAEWQKDTSAADYMTASSCLKFYGAATATSAKTATLTATVAGPATFKFYASSKLSMNTDTGKPQCSVVFTAKNAGGSTISTSTIPCTSTTKTAYQVYSVNLPSGNNTLTWVGSWLDPVANTWNVGNVFIDKFILEKNVAATIPIAKITTSSLLPDRATVGAQVTDMAGESSVNVTSIVVSPNSDYSSPVHTGNPGLVTGLEPLTRYYVKATLTGASGTTYPAIGSFVTPDWTKPTGSVTVSSVQHYSATVDVSVTNPGSETASDIVKTVTVARDAAYIEVIKSGASVPCDLTGLDAGTTYYVRGVLTGPLTGDTYVESTFTTLSASYPLIGSVASSDVGTDRISVNVTVSGFGDGSSGGTVLVEAVAGGVVVASANGTASGAYELTGLDRDTSYTIRVTVTGSNGLSTTDDSLVVKTLNVPVILADPSAVVGAEGASATMSARVAFREATVTDSNVKLYLTEAGKSESLVNTWNSYAQGDVLTFTKNTEPNVDYAYRFVAATRWNSKDWTAEVAGEFRTEYYVTNDWLTVDFESYTVDSPLPASDASGVWTKAVGGVYESSSTVVDFASEFGKGKGLDQTGESTYAKYTATAARPDGIRCLFDADMYFTLCKTPPDGLTDQVLATATTAIFLYSGDEANNFRVYTADGWKDVFAEGFEPANKTFHHVTIDVDYDVTPARVRFTVDGHLLADANGVKWFNRANSSSTAKLSAVSVYGNTKLDGFSAKMLEYANEVCPHANKTETSAAVAPTCTEPGHTAAYRCPDCGRVWEAETISALGHDWGEWTTTKAASTTETGISRRECQRSGCNAYEEQEIPMLANVVALRNVAVVTAVGTAPELPAKVAGLKADGTVDGEYDVVWETASAPNAAGITTVTGAAQVNGEAMTVTASVRAATAAGGDLVNLSPLASIATVTAASKYTKAEELLKSDTPLADNQWADYLVNANNSSNPNTTQLALEWDSPVMVSEVAVYFVNNHSNYQPPDNVKFYNDSDETPTEIAFTAGDIVDSGTIYAHITYSFTSPQALSKLRFYATPIDPNNGSRALFTRRMWVYGPDASAGGSVEPTTTDTLTALAVDGTPIAGFAPTTYSYSVDNGTAISSAVNTDDNVGITILPKYEGSAYVVTLAENGTATQKYTVAMPTVTVCPHEHTSLTGAIAATCTTAGYTGDTVCDDCHESIQTGSVISALGHLWGEWVTTKDPTTTEAGSKKRECQREGCGAEEVVEIPMLEGVTLTLDPKGGTVASTTVDLPADSLPTPTREGYHFVGWFKDEIDADTKQGYVRGRYLCGEPLTSATADDKDTILYAKWVKNDVYSHFRGKKAVFVGDSVSTLHGYAAVNRQVYTSNIFYAEAKAAEQGITATNTWWGQLVQALDMSLLSVNAVAGSPVTDSEPSITYDVRAMSSTARIDDLDVNGTPDVIFIFGGINDFNGNTKAPIDDYDPNASYLTDELDLTSDYFPTFAEGYATMLRRMRHYYPNAEIVAIGPYIAASDRDAYKPVFIKGNTTISNLCARFDVPYLNLMNTQLPYWANGVKLLCDSYHPNQAGFTEFANYVLENYVPACAHTNTTALTGVVAATCTTDGYSGDCTCEDCGETILGHVITKLGHDWSDWVTMKDPSTTETGLKKRECQREGCDAEETEEIPMIVDIVALRNVAVVTAVGTAPTLPAKVAGLKADGTVGGEYDVVWETASAPSAVGVAMVTGTAQVNGAAMSVTASVRAAVAGGDLVNVSPSSTLTSTDPQGAYLSEVVSADEPDPSGFKWMTVLRTNASDMTNTLTWNSSKTISKVRVAYSGHMNHSRPATVDFNTGAANIPMLETSRETVGAHLWVEYTFSQPTAVTTLLCHFTRGSEVNSILVERIWAYEVQGGGSVDPATTDTLTALAVDGNAVAGFAATIYDYAVTNGTAISSAVNTDDNVGITILQKSVTGSDNAYVVTLAENGTATQKYTVSMPAGEDPPVTGASVTLNANGGTVSSTTVELPAAVLPTPTRDGYHFVGWFEDKTLTSYDFTPGGSYVPGTFLYGTPVTAPSADYADKTLYAKWVKTSIYEHFHGKKVAVYGDSVSTLLGFVPSAESEMFNGGVFYGQSYVDKGINEHTQWWGQLVDALGMQLLEINAIGGSSVGAYAYEYGLERKAMMNYTRMRLLDDAGTPDVIIVAAGINDYNDNTTGFNANAEYLANELDRVTSICPDFAKAYALMIRRLQDLYPTTEIVTLSSFDVGAAAAAETGNDCIRRTCALYNVVNIDMRNAFTLNDGTGVDYRPHGIHPGISGFAAIANCFLENYAPIANPVVVPDCGHTWGFGVLTTPATATVPGVRTYTCRHCDATKTEEVPYVALSEGTETDITSRATVKGVYLLPDDRQVAANTVDKQATPLASYNGYLESPANLIDGNADTIYKDWIMNDRYIAFTFNQPMVVTSVKLYGVMNRYPNKIQIVDPGNRLLGKTDGGIPYTSGQHQCTITTTERVATSELRLAVDFEYVGKEFQLKEVEIFGYAAGTEPPIDPPDDPVETEIVALRNIAAVTAVGTAPTLPTKVAGLKADGTVDGEYDVVWETSAAPDSEGITTVAGTAQVNGAAMSVTASVRAANASSGDAELVNVSPSATPTSNDPSAKTHSVPSLVSADSPGDSVVWVTANNGSNLDLINTLTWDSPVTISKVRVCYSGSHKPPSSYAFSSDSSGTPEITFTAGQVETVGNHRWIEFTFGQPTTLSTLRCFFGNPPGWLIVERIWAYEVKGSAGGTIDPLTTDTLSALSVDGNAVAGFAPTTYSYTVENGTAITSATSTDNVGITILPKYEGSAYVVTLAENGTATKKYTVAMPAAVPQATVKIVDRSGKETTVTKPLDEIVDAINSAVASADYGSKVILPAFDTDYTVTLAPGVRVVKNADSKGTVSLVIPSAKSGWYVLNEAGDAMKLSEGAKPVVTDIQVADGASVVTIGNVKVDLYYAVIKSETLFGFETASVVATSGKIASGETFVFELPHGENEPQAFYKIVVTDDPAKKDDPRGGGGGEEGGDDDPVTVDITQYTWCSLGTSITDFNDDPTTGRTKGYQFFLMDELKWDRAKLVNEGHSGTLVSSAASKPPATPCDIYTVEYGVNDWGTGHPVGTLSDYKNYLYNGKSVRWNNFASCYRNLIEMIKAVNPNAVIVLITPRKAYGSSTDAGTKMFPANCDDPTLSESVGDYYDPQQGTNVHGDQTYLKDYADLIKAIGEYEGFPVVDWYSSAATQANLASLSVDNAVHPNDAGYEIMAGLLKPVLLKAVQDKFGEGGGEGDEEDDDDDDPVRSAEYGPWNIQVMDPTHIVMQFDGAYDVEKNYVESGVFSTAPLSTDYALIKDASFTVNGTVTAQAGHAIAARGQMSYTNAQGQAEIVGGTNNQNWELRAVHNLYLTLASPLVEGENTVLTPDNRTLKFNYGEGTVSPLFKVNQVGYAASAAEKYIYLGGWMGTAGAFPLGDSYTYKIYDAASGSVALTGSLTKRMNDTAQNSVAMSGEKTLEADISALTTPGTYYVRVDGIGRSMNFRVSDDAAADQFAVHMLGLYQQRCGCAKEEPYTHWTDTCCHQKVYRGVHPSNDDEYKKCFGGTAQSAFAIIMANADDCKEELTLPGGWHDAADYDRRPYHLQVVVDLANAYLMKPANFTDGQLAVPEKNNGIPDILDEADWGLKFYLAAQQDDGGVGGWAETVTHPDYSNKKMPSGDTEKFNYYLGRATHRSTLKYCGTAANLARALYAVGTSQATARADVYKASAVAAWNYVMRTDNWQSNVEMKGPNGKVYYTEPRWYDPYEYTKAAVNLGVITGNPDYFNHLSDTISYRSGGKDEYNYGDKNNTVYGIFEDGWGCATKDESYGRTGFILSELGLSCAADNIDAYNRIKDKWVARVTANAEDIINSMASAMAYRTAAPYGVSKMAWGACVPLKNAEWLCAAHFFTGDAKYLKAAQLASDYHSGCNPCGATWTSGLGKIYPVAFLSLHSFADSIAEYVPGITPYHNTGSDFGYLFNTATTGRYTTYQSETGAKPWWRRFEVGENMSIGISEYTVTETIGPCAAAAGYLINAGHTTANLDWRQPAAKLSDIPGYWALP